MLGDEEALGDLFGAQVLVEQEQDLHLARRENGGDLVGYAVAASVTGADPFEEPPRDLARKCGLATHDATQELGDPLRRLGLQQVARGAGLDCGEQILLGSGSREDDDFGRRRSGAKARQRLQPVEARHRKVEENDVRLELLSRRDGAVTVGRLAGDLEAMLHEQGRESLPRQGVIVHDKDPRAAHPSPIGSSPHADKRQKMRGDTRDDFQAWLVSELLLVGVLGATLALFLAYPSLPTRYDLPQLRLVLQTTMALACGLVALLAGVRFAVEGRRVDLLLSTGFFIQGVAALAFTIGPTLGGDSLQPAEAWVGVLGGMLGLTLIAIAPFTPGRSKARERALGNAILTSCLVLFITWTMLRSVEESLPDLTPGVTQQQPLLLTAALALTALLNLLAVVGFSERFRRYGEDMDRWLALAATLTLFASLHLVFTPLLANSYVSQGDFLRMIAFAVLLVGALRAIRFAEFGRAVAEERARVAREIHDGLAQYLFAVSTHASMLEDGAKPEETIPRLKAAALAAQQEARFAILALSSASGNAPFDAALRRYIEFLTADGALEVEIDIDRSIRLAPDEQIEIFRIVQEGLANVRKHANARSAEVTIAQRVSGERFVSIRDDGSGFNEEVVDHGQGLKNMQARAKSIDGGFKLSSKPGLGTSLEVVLR